MTYHGARSTGEHGPHQPPPFAKHGVPDREHASMNAMKPAIRDTARDRRV
jgi:hypothetical protein